MIAERLKMAAVQELNLLKLSHKKFRAQLKKLRRKRIRQTLAKGRQDNAESDECDSDGHESASYVKAERLANEELIKEQEERVQERLHCEWLQREVVAQMEFQRRRVKEEQARREKEEKEKQIREEWEALQNKEEDRRKRLEAEAEAKKEREAALLKEATQNIEQGKDPWCNPTAPADYGSELDKHNCPFFLKTGACRFGERCSRSHPRLPVSHTILIPSMFTHFGLDKTHRDEFDSDMGLEYEDHECYTHFREFYNDVLPEFKIAGKVVQFKVCRNFESHLRGNVYVQYEKEEEALAAYNMFNGRYYAGKQLSCQFTSIAKWKSAICGLYQQNRCPKGRNCNFLHVFNNPNDEFFEADRDLSPSKDTSHSRRSHASWRASYRSSSRRSHSPRGSRHQRRSSSHDSRSSRFSSSSRRQRLRSKTSSDSQKMQRRRSRSISWEEVSDVLERPESISNRRQSSRRSRSRDRLKYADRQRQRDGAKNTKTEEDEQKAASETSPLNGSDDKDHNQNETDQQPRFKKRKHSKRKHKKSSSRNKRSSTPDNR